MKDLSEKELEKLVENFFTRDPEGKIELGNLSEKEYKSFRRIFKGNYRVEGKLEIIRDNGGKTNYILYIRRKQDA